MRGMVLNAARTRLRLTTVAVPTPGPGQVLIRVHACAVCRTDLHVVDGDLTQPKLPLIPGHEIVGSVAALGTDVDRFAVGDRVGVPWLGWTCGVCAFCRSGRENLCARARFTGYQIDGGYGEFAVADAALLLRHAGRLQRHRGSAAAVRRTDRLPRAAHGGRGASARPLRLRRRGAHHRAGRTLAGPRRVCASPARAIPRRRHFARELGAVWAGGSDQAPPDDAGRGDHLRAGRRRWCPPRCAPSSAAARWCAPASI